MKSINKLRHILLEDELEIKMYKDKVNIVNYTSIGHFDSNKIIIYYESGNLIISGNDLVVSQLLSNEVLIIGNIKNVELR